LKRRVSKREVSKREETAGSSKLDENASESERVMTVCKKHRQLDSRGEGTREKASTMNERMRRFKTHL
jgi:hypothetical protein